MKQKISSGSFWEDVVGYSRAVKAGNIIEVAGTTAMDAENVIGEGDVYEQAIFIFTKIEKVLLQLGSGLQDIIRTRMYVTNIDEWESVGRAHAKVFRHIKPVATLIEVKRLIDPRLLIEIEITAIVEDENKY
ncbi:MAG: RidA family protein [Chitinophagaceae bacterium]|jgi:enamine deaminase RidA (YjgF/YER057c/UK114 family)|nr:RidA family protein [Chitinophagaceae bacterium]